MPSTLASSIKVLRATLNACQGNFDTSSLPARCAFEGDIGALTDSAAKQHTRRGIEGEGKRTVREPRRSCPRHSLPAIPGNANVPPLSATASAQTAVYDVAIVGGGIMGSAAAYHCARAGLRTVMFESGPLLGHTDGSSHGGRSADPVGRPALLQCFIPHPMHRSVPFRPSVPWHSRITRRTDANPHLALMATVALGEWAAMEEAG